ncbi:hypothetical protein OHC33_008648 [Knufia fluminis]|uniref:Uncharacterized protein n=2 Tax=Knufia TaxID=430999 RepID=A0AAN8EA98_9EURO|nr:hypothetical protein OHC33_008648 [Knufia fluminis]
MACILAPQTTISLRMPRNSDDNRGPTPNTYFDRNDPGVHDPRAYVKRKAVDRVLELQDKGIRREFLTVLESLREIRADSTQRFDDLHLQIVGVDSQVRDVRTSYEELQCVVNNLRAISYNERAYKAWDAILPISVSQQYPDPPKLPDRILYPLFYPERYSFMRTDTFRDF